MRLFRLEKRITHSEQRKAITYLATFTALFSLITVTLICPG
jgi:hypothetical protein